MHLQRAESFRNGVSLRWCWLILGMVLLGGRAAAQFQEGDVSMTICDTPDPVAVGGTVAYDITLTNAGEETFIFYVLGAGFGLSITSVSGPSTFCDVFGDFFFCDISAPLGPGQSLEYHVEAVVAVEFLSEIFFFSESFHSLGFVQDVEITSIIVPPDIDGDGIDNEFDNCPRDANPLQENNDGDAEGDVCDFDDDNDGVGDFSDPDPFDRFTCGDGDEDGCDDCSVDGFINPGNDGPDSDFDGICDAGDNCIAVFNPDQSDADFDGAGDACDICPDTDLNGPIPTVSLIPGHMGDDHVIHGCNATQILSCKPGTNIGERRNGITPDTQQVFFVQKGWGDERDGDGVRDCFDNCRHDFNPDQIDLDGDGDGDACDRDDDGDDIDDEDDNCPRVSNPDQLDTDGNGVGDACEPCSDFGGGEPYILKVAAPGLVTGPSGVPVHFEAISRLAIEEGEAGVQGWSIGVGSRGCTIVATTTDGTVGEGAFFTRAQLAVNAGSLGFDGGTVSATVFFPPERVGSEGSPHDILRFVVEADVPAGGGCIDCTLIYVDGLRGLGQPVPNIVTVDGQSVFPFLCEKTVRVCSE